MPQLRPIVWRLALLVVIITLRVIIILNHFSIDSTPQFSGVDTELIKKNEVSAGSKVFFN